MDPNEEFKHLADLSKWNNTEIAERMELTPAYIGQVRNGNSNIEASRVSHFKLILRNEKPEILGGSELRESAPPSELQIWKRRAMEAESKLHEIREGMRDLIEKSNPSARTPASSTRRSLAGETAAALTGGKKHHPK